MITPYAWKDQYQVIGLNTRVNWSGEAGATSPAVGGGITSYAWKDQYQVIGLGTIVDWYGISVVTPTLRIIKVFMIRDSGTPTTGLSPIIDLFIKTSDGSAVTPIPAVVELDGGYYKFHHEVAQDTVVRVDSGNVLMSDADRYNDVGVITPYDDLLNPPGFADAVWDEDLTTHTTSKSAGWFVRKIKKIVDVILAMVT
jgi:hypothetical protein